MIILEKKGNGHPDTLTDNICESCAKALDKYYMEKYGIILHYNVDKGMFMSGEAEVTFGKAKILKYPEFILGGNVSNLDDELIDYLTNDIRETIKFYLPNLEKYSIEIACTNVSANLDAICSEGEVLANDTSFGVGFYPYSESEKELIGISDYVDYLREDRGYPIGEDFKVMYIKGNDTTRCTISFPYYYNRAFGESDIMMYNITIKSILSEKFPGVSFTINPDAESKHYWLTVFGSSIESGDWGAVGRGNRHYGFINPLRWNTLEAYAGKNNKNHTGKIYQQWATDLAKKYYENTGKPHQVILVSQIGKPINEYIEYNEEIV